MVLHVVLILPIVAGCCCPFLAVCTNFSCSRGKYFGLLRANLEALEENIESLNNLKKKVDVIRKHTPHQARWFDDVTRLQDKARKKKKEAEDELRNCCCRWFFPKHFCCYEGLESELSHLSNDLKDLITKGEAIEKDLYSMVSVEKTPVFGLPSLVDQIEGYLAKSSVRIIGIYDTQRLDNLLEEITKKLCRNFMVILVNVANREKEEVQEDILRKLQLWENQPGPERSSVIRNYLGDKKFLMLLDGLTDQWEHSDLSRIGIPDSEESKIIITAPTGSVFVQMKTDVCVEAKSFESNDARRLFKSFSKPRRPLVMSPEGDNNNNNNKYSFSAEPLPQDFGRFDALAEGHPIPFAIIVVSWVFSVDQEHVVNASWPNGKLVQLMDDQNYLKRLPF